MRTDSNTVLSLSPSVPPKKATLAKSSSESGVAFAKDLHNAKEASHVKKETVVNDSPVTNSASSSSSPVESASVESASVESASVESASATTDSASVTTDSASATADSASATVEFSAQSGGQTSSLVSDENKATGLTAESSSSTTAVTNSMAKSGKILQLEGENLPVNSSDVSVESLVKPSSELTLRLQEETNATTPLQLGDGSTDTVDALAKDDKVANPAAVLGALGAGAGVLVSGTNKQAAAVSLDKAGLPPVDVDENIPAPSLEQENGELSWVLSQMDASVAKAAPIEKVTEGVALDAGKAATTALAAGALVNVVNKESPSGVVPSPLLDSATGDVALSTEVNSDSAETLLGEDGVLINEPIELRKKEQEAMIGRMSAQMDGATADDALGGLNSSLQNHNLNRAAQGAAVAATVVAQNPQQNLAMSVPPGHPGWAGEMTQKVAWIARDGGHTAHIRLDPPELGSLTVKISVDSDSNTQVSFVAATPQARDLLEGQMARLREMLAQQGMDLSRADVDVSQQDASGTQERENYRNSGANQGEVAISDDLDNELMANNVSYMPASGIDYYA
ncbi:flagellar hook-length control protein FliK [Marinomonas shanghaiensis]|uniref:flagellar hook-length control protein FliK n=1 Tax=Marinomonas shanghaiensis TaxID=2202418 RepID=UPI003A946DB7